MTVTTVRTSPTDHVDVPVPSGSGPEYVIEDPSTGDDVAAVRECTLDEVDKRISRVASGWRGWSQTPLEHRASVLASCGDGLRSELESIAAVLTAEQGKPLKEARIEAERCADTFDFYAGVAEPFSRQPRSLEGKHAYVEPLPLGVVGAIVPWNFPLTLLANKLVPALLAGNGVVVKPAPTTPLATAMVLQILHDAGLPDGVVETVLGGGDVGGALVSHPAVRKVSFTGSTATGKTIMAQAAGSVKRLTLELGGSDPMIVSADADLEGAARAAAVGRYFNCGQACIAVKRVYVEAPVFDEFIELVAARVDKLKVGDGRDPEVRVGPQHSEQQLESTLGFVEDALDRGATLVRGSSDRLRGNGYDSGHYMAPVVLADPAEGSMVLTEECFGPVMPVISVPNLDEALTRSNESRYGLGSSIWTTSEESAARAISTLEAGYTWVNDIATDYDPMPFGGIKESGFGKERGLEVLSEYVSPKAVVFGTLPGEGAAHAS